MKALDTLILTLFIAGLFSCTSEITSPEALQVYVLQNDLSKTKNIGSVQLKVSYKPNDLLVAQELRQHLSTTTLIDSLRQKYEDYTYFSLSMSADNKEIETWNTNSQVVFAERVQTLSFGMNNYVQLVTSQQDTIPVSDYAYQRTFGMGRSTDILFAFEREKLNSSNWCQFQLKDFGLGIGQHRFKFNIDDLHKVPALTFK